MCETHINLVYDYTGAVSQEYDFMQLLFGSAEFQVYYRERGTAQKADVDGILDQCNDRLRWIRMNRMTQYMAEVGLAQLVRSIVIQYQGWGFQSLSRCCLPLELGVRFPHWSLRHALQEASKYPLPGMGCKNHPTERTGHLGPLGGSVS